MKMKIGLLIGLLSSISWSQSISAEVLDGASLNAKIKSGGITSSMGEPIVADFGELNIGFQQPMLIAVAPVEVVLVTQIQRPSWDALLSTGAPIRIYELTGHLLAQIPANPSTSDFLRAMAALPQKPYVFESSAFSQSIRFVSLPFQNQK